MNQGAGLFCDRLGYFRVRVSYANNSNTGQEIEILISVFVPKLAPFSPNHPHGWSAVRGHEWAVIETSWRMHCF